MFKDVRVNIFDLVVGGVAIAYMLQFIILTFTHIPTENMTALTDGLKDMRGLFGLAVGAYLRDKVPHFAQSLTENMPGGTKVEASVTTPRDPPKSDGVKT